MTSPRLFALPSSEAPSAGQLRGAEAPVPRWSKTSRSRVLRAGDIASAMNRASGSVAWPGPPASATTATLLGVPAAVRRSTLREIVPGTAPVRSSGTGTVAQPNVGSAGQGVKLAAGEAADEAGEIASSR